MDRRPIGVFDSGVGGLTVVKELIKYLPQEDIVYFGDTAHVPYGSKSRQTIVRFSIQNILFLLKYNVKLIIVACNTSSSVALPALKKNFKVPIMGVIEPGAQDALASTKNRKIGVIGTSTTIRSNAYEKEILKKAASMERFKGRLHKGIKIFSRSCPLFVPLVEEGWLKNNVALQIIKLYLMPLKQKGIDTLILGCTHYPLLKSGIRKVVGDRVGLIDSAISAAKEAKAFLSKKSLIKSSRTKGKYRFFVSDEPDRFRRQGEIFLGRSLSYVKKVEDAI